MSCPRDTKGDKQSKHGKKKDENGKSNGRKDKVNDSNSHGNHEGDPPAGSDLEMDSRLLSALLNVRITPRTGVVLSLLHRVLC